MESFSFKAIAFVKSDQKYKYDSPRQGILSEEVGQCIQFVEGVNWQQAMEGLEGFERIWLIYQFHLNEHWKLKTTLPRKADTKKGVLASRSPYRPNPIGMSCVKLEKIEKNQLWVSQSDLLDQTPILDIKPYIPYTDSFPEAQVAHWLKDSYVADYKIRYSDLAQDKLNFLNANDFSLEQFIEVQLSEEPLNTKKKRLKNILASSAIWCYRTWRISFFVEEESKVISIIDIYSAYSSLELLDTEDKYKDKDLHRRFLEHFS